MNPAPTLLVIADIGGYTRFMKSQQTALAHAQVIIARLLETVIDAAAGLELAKLEGDAAFFALAESRAPDWVTHLPERVAHVHQRFRQGRQQLVADRTCDCESCAQMELLTLKFAAHIGEVAQQRVGKLHELAGVDVIVVHRLLKNHVPVAEYLLTSEALAARMVLPEGVASHPLDEQLEGLGLTHAAYIDLDEMPHAPLPAVAVGRARKLFMRMALEGMALPKRLGFKARRMAAESAA